jgi:hypothetical protein
MHEYLKKLLVQLLGVQSVIISPISRSALSDPRSTCQCGDIQITLYKKPATLVIIAVDLNNKEIHTVDPAYMDRQVADEVLRIINNQRSYKWTSMN